MRGLAVTVIATFVFACACQPQESHRLPPARDQAPPIPPSAAAPAPATPVVFSSPPGSLCAAPRSADAQASVPGDARSVPSKLVELSYTHVPLRCVIRSEAELAKARRLFEYPLDLRELPFDFDRNLLVLATMGEQMTTGYWISADLTWVRGDTTFVLIRTTQPPEAVGDMVTHPLGAALVPAHRYVVFVERGFDPE